MPVRLDHVLPLAERPGRPRIGLWLGALGLLVAAGLVAQALLVPRTQDAPLLLMGPAVLWPVAVWAALAGMRTMIFIGQQRSADGWDESREQDLDLRISVGRRSLSIMGMSLHSALRAPYSQVDTQLDALLRGEVAIRSQVSRHGLVERHMRLHAVPVINLFALEADPLTLDPLQTDYLLRPMRLQDGHTEIYSVDRVTASRDSGREEYVPFSSFRHKGGMLRDEAPERYFHTRLKRGPNGLHDTWLILGGEGADVDRLSQRPCLSLRLTGTNGQLPRKALQSTLLDTPLHSIQVGLRVRNLCAPTLPLYPPSRDRFHWRILSHLGSTFLPMLDNAEVLRGTLALYDWTGSELNRRRLEAIVEVSHHLIQRFEKGFLLRGVDIQITLDADGFGGQGDICLFGEMLNRFFALYADIHLFTQVTLVLQPTGRSLRWSENHSQRIPG